MSLRSLCRLAHPSRVFFTSTHLRLSQTLSNFTQMSAMQTLTLCPLVTKWAQLGQSVCCRSGFRDVPSRLFETGGTQCLTRLRLSSRSHIGNITVRKSRSQGLRCSGPSINDRTLHCWSCCVSVAMEAEAVQGEEGGQHLKWDRGGGMVHSLANVHPSVVVEIGALVDAHASIGANTRIASGSIVGPNVVVGASSTLGYNTVLQNCSLGHSCTLHPGVCIGQDGFGFVENKDGEIVKKPQVRIVEGPSWQPCGDWRQFLYRSGQAERNQLMVRGGSWRDTVIGDHTKIDNLVQIGHNVVIGRCCMICGQVGLAGSTNIGDYVVLGGKSGVSDHVSVTSRVRIAAKSGVMSNIDKPGDYAGFPAVPAREWRKAMVAFRKMGRATKKQPTTEEAQVEDLSLEVH